MIKRKDLFLVLLFISINIFQNCYSRALKIHTQINGCLCHSLSDEEIQDAQKAKTFVIKNNTEREDEQQNPYFQLIKKHGYKLPKINFEKQMIFAYFLGISDPSNLMLEKVDVNFHGKQIFLYIQNKTPQHLRLLSFPFCIAITDKIAFIDSTEFKVFITEIPTIATHHALPRGSNEILLKTEEQA